MPIAPELRHFYRTPDWFAARSLCMERAKGKCEWCGKPKGSNLQALDRTGRWFNKESGDWVWPRGFAIPWVFLSAPPPKRTSTVRCILTTAHLDHNPGNNSQDNLAGLCQRCHLVYDGPHHRETARLRRDRETGQLRLELVP